MFSLGKHLGVMRMDGWKVLTDAEPDDVWQRVDQVFHFTPSTTVFPGDTIRLVRM